MSTAESQIKLEDGKDEEMARSNQSIYLYWEKKLEVLKSRKKVKLGVTSNKEFNLFSFLRLHQKLKQEQHQSKGKKRKVIMKEVKTTGKKLKEVQEP